MTIAHDVDVDASAGHATTSTESLSLRIVEAVAAREGTDPVALSTPLYEAVDPDALDALFEDAPHPELRATFRYHGYRVTVTADGEITVDED